MGTVIESTAWKPRLIETAAGFRVSTPAEPFVKRMAQVSDPYDRLFLACLALRRDEDCIEANIVVADAQESYTTRVLYLNIAVEEGHRLWDPVIQTYDDLDLWDTGAARPWLHAIKALADEFFDAGWYDDAQETYTLLLAMDPGDHLGARESSNRIEPQLAPSV